MKKGRGRPPKRQTSDNSAKILKAADQIDNMQAVCMSEKQLQSPPKRPKRSAGRKNMKDNSTRLPRKSLFVDKKLEKCTDEEEEAVQMTTSGQPEGDRPNRRLTDFVLHDDDGNLQPLEMLETRDMCISGIILPLEVGSDKEEGVRCQGFGRIEEWDISGYEDGYPVIWLSTEIADYDCRKPASGYKKYYEHFFEKARACVEVYKKVMESDPDHCSLDELLAGVIRSMSGSRCFSGSASIKEFLISQGEFIYNQLIGLDETSSQTAPKLAELPVLLALKKEGTKFSKGNTTWSSLETNGTGSSVRDENDDNVSVAAMEDEDAKAARLLQEAQCWKLPRQKKSASVSSKFYIKIDEDELANDYPLPAYYKTSNQEIDEFLVFDNEFDDCDPDDLPRSMLHDWALYNSDSRLISLELLPMRPCADIDVVVFGSGVTTADDGSGFMLENDAFDSSSSSRGESVDGIPIYLSSIKEWTLELGPSMIFVSIRTDNAWYRLGKPSKQYARWYEPVLKTARLGVSIITLLKEQSRVARLSFKDVIKKVSEFGEDHPSYISSYTDAVRKYVVVHGQIILQLFAEYPDHEIKKCTFVSGLIQEMEQKHHTKWLLKKKRVERGRRILNPRASHQTVIAKKKTMQATTTKLINRIWGEYYSNYYLEDTKEGTSSETKEGENEGSNEQDENEEDDVEDEVSLVSDNTTSVTSESRHIKTCLMEREIRWDGDPLGTTDSGNALYKKARVFGDVIAVESSVLVEVESNRLPAIYYIEYMFETSDKKKMFHGRMMQHSSETVLGSTANECEIFLTNECKTFNLKDIKQTMAVEIRRRPWGHQYRKDNLENDRLDREMAEERKKKGLPLEYFCKSLYWPEKGAFFSLPFDSLGLGSGICYSCKMKETEMERRSFKLNSSKNGFLYRETEFSINDYIYISPHHVYGVCVQNVIFKGGRNIGLKAYVICQLLDIIAPKDKRQINERTTQVKVRRFFRPEDISSEKAYHSDIREIYYSEVVHVLSAETIAGRCEVKKKSDVMSCDTPVINQHAFFCERTYDPAKGSFKQLPAHIKIKCSTNAASSKNKSKKDDNENQKERGLATMDIFAGCGGLSEGLRKAGVSITKWAIEYEEPDAKAFKLNHPESCIFIKNCNVILRAIMEKCGDIDDCISTSEAAELAAKLDKKEIENLPLPGQVEFINGGPPCQGFSGMNRFSEGAWSTVQCQMILAFLSFADYYRPKYFLLENVRNFVSYNKGQTFRLTIASLLAMGYQVRFGILEAGAYGVGQSRKRAFIWAASPEETLPDWPQPMHVFRCPELKIKLSDNMSYAAVRSTTNGAPYRSITVRDTIGDLPVVRNGASQTILEYQSNPISWFQKKIRGDMMILNDHISKAMNELNLIRCQRIPKRPGADWRDLPNEKVRLSSGEVANLVPWFLPNSAERHNQWKGLFGRLIWEGNFPTSVTDPQPMGKVAMCFHPNQDRIVTVRECARSQGFPDSYQFVGNIQDKHRQIGNAVPPPLAYALGIKLKEALLKNKV